MIHGHALVAGAVDLGQQEALTVLDQPLVGDDSEQCAAGAPACCRAPRPGVPTAFLAAPPSRD